MKYILSTLLIFSSCYFGFSQVGINTIDPDTSAALDIVAKDSGILIPRMTSIEREAIAEPAKSLMVFDTDENAYYYNAGDATTANWTPFLSKDAQRDNYVIVKSVEDFPNGGQDGATITLDENTLYEVNGTVTTNQSIDVNGAYLIGKDTNEDILNYTGSSSLFIGSATASFRNITFNNSGTGNLFNLAASPTNSLIAQSVVVNGFSSVGTVSSYGLVFFNVVQYIGNSDGITYTDIGNLLLNNMGWQASNTGTYETFTGSFGFIQKASGFTTVSAGAVGLDVSANPSVGTGTLFGTVFAGGGTYVAPYTAGAEIYEGFNFSNNWTVNSPGIKSESDNLATGTIYIQRNSTNNNPTFSIATRAPIEGITDASNLFRMSSTANGLNDNVLQYNGNKTRTFTVTGSLSYQATQTTTNLNSTIHAFYLRRYDSNGATIDIPLGTEVYEEVNNNSVRAVPIAGTIVLDPGDYVRVFGQVISGNRSTIRAYSLSLSLD
ncbi:hypothetical protein ACFQ3R_12590 [Mesonia ostreae]|uniref:Cell wall anchor protein n=1 Tax=Mesonia ostreae TaxID=861110 RepID=A0ABU2KFI7_9FLAO|nr:hypothetical protein [Mesonia ostreae]MDT0293423.1 hypothetical protein [Mesonia ostreae]